MIILITAGLIAAGTETALGVLSAIALFRFSAAISNHVISDEPLPLSGERYIAFTTFQRNGSPKTTPVWPVDAGDGKIGFITSSHTWKVKRLAHNNRVVVQPSDARGRVRPGTQPTPGTASVVAGIEFETIDAKVRTKYGWQLRLINLSHALPRLVGKPGHPNDRTVLITFDT